MSDMLPALHRRRRISLTPLVDVIFLLLIFFMLTTQIAPFSLISLTGAARTDSQSPPVEPKPIVQKHDILIVVLNGGVAINGQVVLHADIDQALAQARNNGAETAIISPRSNANVQDLITVLEAVKKATFRSISLKKPG